MRTTQTTACTALCHRVAAALASIRQHDWRDVGGLDEADATCWREGLARLERAELATQVHDMDAAHELIDVALSDLSGLILRAEALELEAVREAIEALDPGEVALTAEVAHVE